jgi:hypothetical protein
VRRHQFLLVADALAEDDGADEGRDAGVDVDDGAAGEVQRAPAEDQAGRGVIAAQVPDHVRDRVIDDGEPDDGEDHERGEFHPLDEPADDQRDR